MEQSKPWVIVGLGNPGSEYQNTRHNVGRATVELLATRAGARFSAHRSQTMLARVNLAQLGDRAPAILAYSRSYMNTSGPPVAGLAKLEGIPSDRILIIHDDLDLEAHTLRLKMGGGSGGHNGLKSISAALKDQEYSRLRIGVGRPPGSMDAARYVLAQIPKAQSEAWEVTYQLAADTATDVVMRGLTKAQMDLHSRESR